MDVVSLGVNSIGRRHWYLSKNMLNNSVLFAHAVWSMGPVSSVRFGSASDFRRFPHPNTIEMRSNNFMFGLEDRPDGVRMSDPAVDSELTDPASASGLVNSNRGPPPLLEHLPPGAVPILALNHSLGPATQPPPPRGENPQTSVADVIPHVFRKFVFRRGYFPFD